MAATRVVFRPLVKWNEESASKIWFFFITERAHKDFTKLCPSEIEDFKNYIE